MLAVIGNHTATVTIRPSSRIPSLNTRQFPLFDSEYDSKTSAKVRVSALLTAKAGRFLLKQLEFQDMWQPQDAALTIPKHTQCIPTPCHKARRMMSTMQYPSSFVSPELRVHLWNPLKLPIYISLQRSNPFLLTSVKAF
jgi:hypothetical protein